MKISNAEKRKYNAEGWYKRFMASEQKSCTVRIGTAENTDWVTDRVQLTAKDGQNGRMVIAESTKGYDEALFELYDSIKPFPSNVNRIQKMKDKKWLAERYHMKYSVKVENRGIKHPSKKVAIVFIKTKGN